MYLIRTLKIATELPERDHIAYDEIILDDRCPGFFKKYEEAYSCCLNNRCDIFEDGYYNYALLFKIGEGLYRNEEEIQWFQFQRFEDNYAITTCERPHQIGLAHSPTNILPLIIG